MMIQKGRREGHVDDETRVNLGLARDEALKRLRQIGPNEPVPVKRAAIALQIIALFANPLVLILLLASLISAFVRDFVNAAIIIAIVLLSGVLNFIQTSRSSGEMSLNEHLDAVASASQETRNTITAKRPI